MRLSRVNPIQKPVATLTGSQYELYRQSFINQTEYIVTEYSLIARKVDTYA